MKANLNLFSRLRNSFNWKRVADNHISTILEQNTKLLLIVEQLHKKISKLNDELERLTVENITLKYEMEDLNFRVESIQLRCKSL